MKPDRKEDQMCQNFRKGSKSIALAVAFTAAGGAVLVTVISGVEWMNAPSGIWNIIDPADGEVLSTSANEEFAMRMSLLTVPAAIFAACAFRLAQFPMRLPTRVSHAAQPHPKPPSQTPLA